MYVLFVGLLFSRIKLPPTVDGSAQYYNSTVLYDNIYTCIIAERITVETVGTDQEDSMHRFRSHSSALDFFWHMYAAGHHTAKDFEVSL